MKIKLLFLLLFCLNLQLYSCPSCVGIVTQESPPFFAEEFYQPQDMQIEYDFVATGTGS